MILFTIITKVSYHSTSDIKRLRGSTHWSGLIGTSVEGCHGSRFAWTEPCHRNIPTLLPYVRLGNSCSSPPEPVLVSNFVSKSSAYSVQEEFANYHTMHIARMLLQACKRRNPSSNPVDYYVIRSPGQREPSLRRLWPSCRIRIQKKSKAVPRAPKSGHNKSNYIKRGLTGSKKDIESCEILKIEDDIGKSAILRYPCGEIRTQQQRWRAFDSAFQKGH